MSFSKILAAILFNLGLTCSSIAIAQQAIEIHNNNFPPIDITPYAWEAKLPEGSTPADLDSPAVRFSKLTKIQGITDKIHYIKVKIDNQSNDTIQAILLHRLALTSRILVFELKPGDKAQALATIGSQYPASSRPINFRKPAVPLSVTRGQHTYLIVVDSLGSMDLGFSLINTKDFVSVAIFDSCWIFFMIGVIAFSILYNIFFYLKVRYDYFLYYVGFCIANLSLYCLSLGLTQLYVFPTTTETGLLSLSTVILVCVTVILKSIFSMKFLDSQQSIPHLHGWIKLQVYAGFALMTFAIYEFVATNGIKNSFILCFLVGLLLVPFSLYCGIVALYRGYKPAFHYVIAWGSEAVLIFFMCLMAMGIISWKETGDTWALVGAALHACLLSLGLGSRIKTEVDQLQKELRKNINQLDRIVEEKTAKLRFLLNNSKVGIFKFDTQFSIDTEYSRACLTIFNKKDLTQVNAKELLFGNVRKLTDKEKQGLAAIESALGESLVAFELNAGNFPSEIRLANGKYVELDWEPLVFSRIVQGFLVTARDVSDFKIIEEKRKRARDEIHFLMNVVKYGKERYIEYLKSERELIRKIRKICWSVQSEKNQVSSNSISGCVRDLHTIKGNARTYGLDDVANLIHSVESQIVSMKDFMETAGVLNSTAKKLEGIFERSIASIERHLPAVIHHRDTAQIVGYITSLTQFAQPMPPPIQEEIHNVTSYLREHVATSLEQILSPVRVDLPRIAERLGKPSPLLHIETPGVFFKEEFVHKIKSILIHVVRNSADHGIETPEIRLKARKSAIGNIYVSAKHHGDHYRMIVEDDGVGLEIREIGTRAIGKGLIPANHSLSLRELASLIFVPHFSIRSQITEISGRGVGLDAVREYVKDLKGSIEIEFRDRSLAYLSLADYKANHLPFRLVIHLPLSIFL